MAEFMYLFLLFDTYIDVHNEFRAFSSFVILSHNKTFVFQQALSYYNVLFFFPDSLNLIMVACVSEQKLKFIFFLTWAINQWLQRKWHPGPSH